MNLRPIVRASAPIAVAASLTLLLAACGSSAKTPTASKTSPSKSASPSVSACSVKAGATSNAVTATGAYGKTPTVKVQGALKATDVERTVLIKGTGAAAVNGDTINAHFSMFNGTGKKLIDQDAQVPLGDTVRPVFRDALACVNYGSRTVVTAPASTVYSGSTLPSGVKSTDTLIIVTDVESVFAPVPWTTQVPTVTFDKTGKPTVKLSGKPIKAWALKILKQGTGAVVKSGDNVTVNYQGTNWNTGKIFDQSYGRGAATFNTTQVVTGFGGALVGQKVGTRLVVTIPPQYGYGVAKTSNGLGGQTLVFVIEIQKAVSQ